MLTYSSESVVRMAATESYTVGKLWLDPTGFSDSCSCLQSIKGNTRKTDSCPQGSDIFSSVLHKNEGGETKWTKVNWEYVVVDWEYIVTLYGRLYIVVYINSGTWGQIRGRHYLQIQFDIRTFIYNKLHIILNIWQWEALEKTRMPKESYTLIKREQKKRIQPAWPLLHSCLNKSITQLQCFDVRERHLRVMLLT